MKRSSKLIFLNLKSILRFGMKTLEGNEQLLTEWFLPDNYKRDLYLRVSSLGQDHLSARSIYVSLNNSKLGVVLRTERTMVRFLRGLEPNIAENVDIQPYWSFEEVC